MISLKIPFRLKDKARALGARWNPEIKAWELAESSANVRAFRELLKAPEPFAVPTREIRPELVPATAWYSNLRNALELKSWQALQQYFGEQQNYRCAITGTTGDSLELELHEHWHFNPVKRIQKLTGFSMLAPQIHECMHPGLAQINDRLEHVKDTMVFYNSLLIPDYDHDDAERVLADSFEEFHRLSRVPKWELDLSFVKSLPVTLQFKS